MRPKTFAQPTWIEFEGERVFRLLNRYPDHARFELIGFEGQIFINEYRQTCLQVLDAIISKTQDVAAFAYSFSSPAFVNIPDIEAPRRLARRAHRSSRYDGMGPLPPVTSEGRERLGMAAQPGRVSPPSSVRR